MSIIKTEAEMITFGENLAKTLKSPLTIELIGDVGAGKTTLVKGIARGLGITTPITSPSFTLSKSYTIPLRVRPLKQEKDVVILNHYDFYRLPDPGNLAEDLAESVADPSAITIVEWAETVSDFLPKNRLQITLKYRDDASRSLTLSHP